MREREQREKQREWDIKTDTHR